MRFLLTIILFVAIGWCSALTWFVRTIPDEAPTITEKAQVLVVLTGGYARIEHGLNLLAEKEAPILYISGVADKTTQSQLLRAYASAELRQRVADSGGEIVMDQARSTVSNAQQTAQFVSQHHFTSIRLITANYHMRRALREFRHTMPEVTIIPDPVSPKEFQRGSWWTNDIGRRVIFGEFHKTVAVYLRDWLRGNEVPPSDASALAGRP